jgi:hypothetical protein
LELQSLNVLLASKTRLCGFQVQPVIKVACLGMVILLI